MKSGTEGAIGQAQQLAAALEQASTTRNPARNRLIVLGWSVLLLGLIVASISAFFAIWGLMRILEQFSTWPFVIYRFMLGVVILAGVAAGWLV
jgi:undecaprenyl pyrophosphate phosphatase UppP